MTRAVRAGLLVLMAAAAVVAVPGDAHGQSLLWAGYGRTTDDASRLSTGEALTVGYGLFRPTAGLAATIGLPVDMDGSSRWGTAAGWFERQVAGPLGASGSGTVFAFDDPLLDVAGVGSTLALDAHTAFSLGTGELRLRVGGRHGIHSTGGERSGRLLGRAGTGAALAAGVVHLRADLDHWRAEEAGYTQVAARIAVASPRIQAWAGTAHWLDDALPGTGWDVGVRVPVTDRVALMASGGVQADDILFSIPRQRTWSLAVQLRTGAATGRDLLPRAVLHDARRTVTLSLPDRGLDGRPGVAGTFSDWRTLPMERTRRGWRIELTLEPGIHEYSFVTEDGIWFVPEDTPGRKPDGFGGHVAVLIVQ